VSSPPDGLPLAKRDLCFLDLETTGSVFGYHEIIEIAAIRTDPSGAEVKGTWEHRVRPRNPDRVSALARDLTGFDPAAWTAAEEPDVRFWRELTRFVDGCVPVCHNPSFDRAFITLSAAAVGVQDLGLDYHWIGTESLAWPLYLRGLLPKLSLATLCDYLGVGAEPFPHRAIEGAQACRRAYFAMMTRFRLPVASEPLAALATAS
jgi:DNA polymerase III epsilon subunit-like protein